MIEPLVSPWIEGFEAVVRQAKSSLILCSPYIGRGPCERTAELLRDSRPPVSVLVVTDLSRDTMLSGATDVGALADFSQILPEAEIRFLPSVHAKVYVADEQCAVVTSGNLTYPGLCVNLEYGLLLREPRLVSQVRTDIMRYGSLGSRVDLEDLRAFQAVIADLKETRDRAERSMRARLRKEFDARLDAAQQEILRVRAESLSAHAAFADTILYVLGKGPKTTKQLYTEVQRIHPDLCDDAVKLVIRGEQWNQVKWHHRVRHAQLFLKRQGRIRRDKDKWEIVG